MENHKPLNLTKFYYKLRVREFLFLNNFKIILYKGENKWMKEKLIY